MKILNNQYRGTSWSNGKYPNTIHFDELTANQIPFLEMIGFDFLVIDVCDNCLKEVCECTVITEEESIADLEGKPRPRPRRKKKNETD